nr:putative disease resistance protein RGA4 isoform X2 [Ziziphus jujuba var. spinosa]
MAENILFSIAEAIVGKLGSFALKEIGLLWGVKNDLRKLNSTMSTIKDVLLDAEEKQTHNHQVRGWLTKLQVIVYDADDLVDKFDFEALRRRVMPGNKMRKQVCIFFSSSNQLAFALKMGHRIKEIRESLDEIRIQRDFHLDKRVEETKSVSAKARETYSFVREEEVIGRDDERMKILQLLLQDDETKENVSTITIVGIGGLGKTTLAQLVFNDAMVQKHFEPRLWVCVSDVFEMRPIVGNIIKSATNSSPDQHLAMDQLQNLLRKQIDGKRYFLVLDDVWNEDRKKWLELKSLLMGGARGSRILVTTRSENVAKLSHTLDDQPFKLNGLENDKSWSLFSKMAFRQVQDLNNPKIVDLGKAILEKCKGVPLAIKTIGSILYFKNPETEWSFFRDNELAKVTQQEDDIIPTLKLSYNHLPSYLKHCFAYCSLFPKDHEFDVQMLIHLWMAQGFIKADQNQFPEDIGYGYFLDLLWRSFFQEGKKDGFGNIRRCKMHDLMHDLAMSVAGTSSVLINKGSISSSENLFHVSFDFSLGGTEFLTSVSPLLKHHYKLRTLFVLPTYLGHEQDLTLINCMENCLKFKLLRALDLNRFYSIEKLPNSFGELKHLRYLDLSNFENIQKLPNSITNLHNLQTLNLAECEELSSLPRDMHKLVSLRHLLLDECSSLSHMPSRLGELTCLHTLSRFVLPGHDVSQLRPRNKSIGEVGELRNLNSLRGKLSIENLRPDIDESDTANLQEKQHLQELKLWYLKFEEDHFVEKYEKSLELLRPHPNLKALRVYGYLGVGFASWVKSLTNLVSLRLYGCTKCRHLPALHELPHLQKLTLEDLDCLEYIDDDQNTATSCDIIPFFPSLKVLFILWCPKLTSMPLFPSLERLVLHDTSSKPLRGTMMMAHKEASSGASPSSSFQSLSKLVEMTILDIDDLQSLPQEGVAYLSSLQSLQILGCPNLTSLPESIGNLSSLRSLEIGSCPNLTSLPESIGNLSSLRSLQISYCPKLTSLPEGQMLRALMKLSIKRCPMLQQRYNNTSGVDWPKIAHIPNVEFE